MSTLSDVRIRVPAGAKGDVKTLCPECSHERRHANDPCLSVNVEAGVWKCHNCGWSGSLRRTTERRQWQPVEHRSATPTEKMRQYFASRGISEAVLERNRVTQIVRTIDGTERGVICFNYFAGDTLVNVKMRDGAKNFSQVKGGEQIAYKVNDLVGETSGIITEGEIDALSFEMAGYLNAVSVPGGAINPTDKSFAGKLKFIDLCAEYLEPLETIYLATDSDEPGIRLREELARRLGRARCYIVRYPEGSKDANDVLRTYGPDRLARCIREAMPYPVEGVLDVESQREQYDLLYEVGFAEGATTGLGTLDGNFTWHDSQFTVVTGVPSHGKSTFMDHVCTRLMTRHDWRIGFFTPENNPISIHLIRLSEQLVGKPFLPKYNGRMSHEEKEAAREYLQQHAFYIKPEDDMYTIDKVLDCARDLVKRYGIDMLVLDPWSAFEHQHGKESETVYSGRVLNKLRFFARNHGIHLVLVAHPTKMGKDKKGNIEVPNLYNINGSAHFYNMADNGLVVYRKYQDDRKTSHTIVYVAKVKHKHVGIVGNSSFDFELSNQRYRSRGATIDRMNELPSADEPEPEPPSNLYVPQQTDEAPF